MTAQVSTGPLVALAPYATGLLAVNWLREKAMGAAPVVHRGRLSIPIGHGRSAVTTPLQQASRWTLAPPQCCRRCRGLRRSPCGEAGPNEDRCCRKDLFSIHGWIVSPHPSLLGIYTSLYFPGMLD
ncbi:unnamed protein product [Spirodela intermedia]|uniref:Uncharacterized protein n=2 Tax=Spirodela intermedia TaxID=51605 RepID=A0A7I8LER2_SPIIN|nr:unnamed protein product [Spirodela intermedia]CAA6671220.1 unnamed protein product [Spirodela intermedia]CAA7408330.1 unnamed protein product [Spirodela intermedia]